MTDNGGRFLPGDPRINRKGRPRNFDRLRELSLDIANEPAVLPNGQPIIINGKKVTVIEAILRQWFTSKNPALQRAAVEIAYGKVPDQLNLDAETIFRVIYEDERNEV